MVDAAATALGGAALGGVISGVSAWLNDHAQARRQREQDLRQARRASYAEFLLQAQVLWNTSRREVRELKTSRADGSSAPRVTAERTAHLRNEANAVFDDFARILMSVQLIASDEVYAAATASAEDLRSFDVAVIQALDDLVDPAKSQDSWGATFSELSRLSKGAGAGQSLRIMQREIRG